MRHISSLALALIGALCWNLAAPAQDSGMAVIRGGSYVPLYGKVGAATSVAGFAIDSYPVSYGQYLDFVQKNPKWQKGRVVALFADGNYLAPWRTCTRYPPEIQAEMPITYVSWYAAKAYCECQGKRLPTLDEWEYVAMADPTHEDARAEPSYNQAILDWYERPPGPTRLIGQERPNIWGVYDLHGLVWEWTSDFNSVLISGEGRSGNGLDRNLFCAAGAVGATDLMNYAALMRYAFRASVKANYALKNLGFRCAKDVPP